MGIAARKLQVARRLLRERGLLSVLNVTMKKIFPSDNYFLSWESRVLMRCSPSVNGGRNIGAGRLPEQELPLMLGINNLTATVIEAAAKRGEQCWVLRENGTTAAYVWISSLRRRIVSDTGYLINTHQGPAYWWRDVYVRPERRGTGLPAELLAAWWTSLPQEQQADIYTEVAPDNVGSLKAHARLGFTTIGNLYMFCVLGARFYYVRKSQFPRFAFRFFPHNVYYSCLPD